MGPALGVPSPVQLTFRFLKNPDGTIQSVALRQPDGRTEVARRIAVDAREVSFTSGDVKLAGTLLIPPTKGPHPAIVLLHGSGPLTRWSFGPYPRFFASLGFAVLVYDKRASGVPPAGFYPDVFLNDAIEAIQFLETRSDIDPRQIGVWGTSEGGMLGTQVAARKPNVAFVINSSGFMMPLWEQVLYNIEAQLRADGFSAIEVNEAVRFETFAVEVMRTGDKWDEYERAQAAAIRTKWWSAYLWRNRDVTIRIFEQGNHPLMDARSGGNAEIPGLTRMVPGVFDTIRMWLSSRITPAL